MTHQDDYDRDDDHEQDEDEQTEGGCDRCTGSTPEDLERAISGASIAPVCACAIGQGASPEDCVCGPDQEGNENQ
ncbi:hypothetical protein AB0F46_18805 [Streptomyces sp. NPDC026665]|uniref:hypothetical protein n=1 Tax=Streptomyces sp. NPDC026665 TaxID=3154798 RepID=UPI0033FD5E4C